MEEYTQITLDEWTQWKEDIRRKLSETASNFVYIGYRLKQIRDSGMYDGAADVFEFAQKEYGLGKSTVSRFIAINEKYSEGGNSLELKEEFRNFSSSKLAEMLTLPDSEIQMITEKTTIREIRELKAFNGQIPEEAAEEAIEAAGPLEAQEWSPLEKCLIDFFKGRKEMLNDVMKHLETEQPEYKQAAELMAPSGQASHKKGIVFLFMYDWDRGIKYKLMIEPEPVSMDWPEFLNTVYHIFGTCDQTDVWKDFYGEQEENEKPKEEEQKAEKKETVENVSQNESIQREEGSVATSQQDDKSEEKTEPQTETPGQQETMGQQVEEPEMEEQEAAVSENEESGENEAQGEACAVSEAAGESSAEPELEDEEDGAAGGAGEGSTRGGEDGEGQDGDVNRIRKNKLKVRMGVVISSMDVDIKEKDWQAVIYNAREIINLAEKMMELEDKEVLRT